jgi:shikimate kinase
MTTAPRAAGTERPIPEQFSLHKTIVLVGMMGVGKSAVGRALASRLGVPLLDSDAEIELAANATIAEIFARDGEPFFRARESEVIERLLAGVPCVLSTGGGAFLAARNRNAISSHGASLWLCADLELLWDRVRHKETRPLLRTADPKQTLKDLCAAREPFYAMADLKVHTLPHYSIDETTDKVIEALLERPDILERT